MSNTKERVRFLPSATAEAVGASSLAWYVEFMRAEARTRGSVLRFKDPVDRLRGIRRGNGLSDRFAS